MGVLMLGYMSQSCQEPAPSTGLTEFIADSTTFVGFTSWTLVNTTTGPSTELGAMAHGAADSTVSRDIYYKDDQGLVNGTYPVGTLIAKRIYNPSGTVEGYFGMAKRGNGFNSTHNDWEWFKLDATGKILKNASGMEERGGLSMTGCNNCHSGATNDYSFSK